ncbi:MAG: hypothetical protein AB1762_04735, partial [Gemmatimonadota bacterium]
ILFSTVMPDVAERALRSLRFANQQISHVVHLLRTWKTLGDEMRRALRTGRPPQHTLRRWAAQASRPAFPLLLRVAHAVFTSERASGRDAPTPSALRTLYKDGVRTAYRDPVAVADLAIDGDDLVAAGIAPGPGLGKILAALLDAVLEDPSRNTRETLLALARQHGRGT